MTRPIDSYSWNEKECIKEIKEDYPKLTELSASKNKFMREFGRGQIQQLMFYIRSFQRGID